MSRFFLSCPRWLAFVSLTNHEDTKTLLLVDRHNARFRHEGKPIVREQAKFISAGRAGHCEDTRACPGARGAGTLAATAGIHPALSASSPRKVAADPVSRGGAAHVIPDQRNCPAGPDGARTGRKGRSAAPPGGDGAGSGQPSVGATG
jgi:hypothetical protein